MGRVIAVAVACSGGPLPPGGAEESGLRLPVQVWEPNLTHLFSSQPTRVLAMGGGGEAGKPWDSLHSPGAVNQFSALSCIT